MINGWVVINKPLGLSSMQTTARVKRILSTRKAGHAGTLDPLATGVLPIALGKATKTISYMMDAHKSYEFTVRWGEQTSTDDQEGEVLSASEVRPTEDQIHDVLKDFVGEILQTPPQYSAVKVNGKRAYAMARAGKEVNLSSRPVMIHDLKLLRVENTDHATFRCYCGKGTYIRSLARDIALKLGAYGHISYLRRTSVGVFDEKNAISLDFLENIGHKGHVEDHLFPLDRVLDDIPDLVLSKEEEKRFCHGQRLPWSESPEEQVQVCRDISGNVVGLAKVVEGKLQPIRLFKDV